jgi:hypothetical protein
MAAPRFPRNAPARKTKNVCNVNGTGWFGISICAPIAISNANVNAQKDRICILLSGRIKDFESI